MLPLSAQRVACQSEEVEMPFCEGCGSSLIENARFCEGCGASVSGSTQAASSFPPVSAPNQVNSPGLFIVGAVLCVGAGWWLVQQVGTSITGNGALWEANIAQTRPYGFVGTVLIVLGAILGVIGINRLAGKNRASK
jgi:hypothetical protein